MTSRLLVLLLAPFVGSFLGVLIRRLPEERAVIWGRSACEHCGAALRPCDLVPLLSYILSDGRCRHCGGWIDPEHILVELASIAVAASAALTMTGEPLVLSCLLGWGLLALAWIDWRTMLLPDALTLPLLLIGLAATWRLDPDALTEHAIAAVLGYALLSLCAEAYRRLRGRDGLGLGDAKLLGVAGAWLGLEPLPWVVLVGSMMGLLWFCIGWLRGSAPRHSTAIAFGPFLATAIWAALLLAAR
jgi:leader peptidase (prepilin peptidase) / N-methyltransferase